MVSGAFKSFRHEHLFISVGDKTKMIDKFHYISPLGILGKIADVLFLKNYMKNLLLTRNSHLKIEAEEN